MATEVIVDRTQVSAAPSLARRVSWGAILAGLFVTIIIQLLFTLLGAAVAFLAGAAIGVLAAVLDFVMLLLARQAIRSAQPSQ